MFRRIRNLLNIARKKDNAEAIEILEVLIDTDDEDLQYELENIILVYNIDLEGYLDTTEDTVDAILDYVDDRLLSYSL